MLNRVAAQVIAIIAMGAIACSASAATISMDNFTGSWSNVVGGVNFGTIDNGGNNPQARWGVDLGSGQSGYAVDMAPPPPVPIIKDVPPNTAPFFIGSFTHFNQPIAGGSSISSIDLRVAFDLTIDGLFIGNTSFDFRFFHDETPNGANPCAYGGANNQGVNINGCADRVAFSYLNTSDVFLVDGVEYTFNLIGFSTDGGASLTPFFLTTEQLNNVAGLYATIQTRASIGVPEPGSLALLGLGLLGLGAARRKAA